MAHQHTSTRAQSAMMQLLLATHPTLLSRGEIRREMGSAIEADDALGYLLCVGLAHRLAFGEDEFFWATRAAIAGEEACTAHLVT